MDTRAFIEAIDVEISRLQQVKTLLTGASTTGKRNAKRPASAILHGKPIKRRTMSPEARARIAAAQRARWAKIRKSRK